MAPIIPRARAGVGPRNAGLACRATGRGDYNAHMHRTRDRRPFWFFVAAMALALAGGGGIVLLARHAASLRGPPAKIEPPRAPSPPAR
jgi:hypothetical protein